MPATPKPAKGTARKQVRKRKSAGKRTERAIMREAVALDGGRCRVPVCQFMAEGLPIDPCHRFHRGMGGNPSGSRTTLETVIALCRRHHRMYDAGILQIDPLTDRDFRGTCAFTFHQIFVEGM